MRLKIVALLSLLFLFLSQFASADYNYTYTGGEMDISSYCTSGTNCWHAMNSGSVYDLDEGGDGQIVATSGSSTIFIWNYTTRTWGSTNEGGTWTGVAVQDQYHVYLLGAAGASGCTSPNRPVYSWDGSHLPSLLNECLVTIYVSKYGTYQLLEGINAAGQAWYSTNSGSSWSRDTAVDTAVNMFFNDYNDRCMVKGGVLYSFQAAIEGNWQTFSPAPGGTIAGCIFASTSFGNVNGADSSQNFVLVWTTTGVVKMYNPVAGTWATISGSAATKVVGPGKDNIVEVVSGGFPYHYNLFARTMTLTGSGNFSGRGCPIPAQPCNPGIKHKITAHIYYPHELQGSVGMQEGTPDATITASSTAVSAKCDPFFGSTGDGECNVNIDPGVNNEALCEQSDQTLATPPAPPIWSASQDVRSSHNGVVTAWYTVPLGPGGDIVTVVCETDDSCKPPTVATCPNVTATVEESCGGLACDPIEMESEAAAKCTYGEYPNSWVFQVPYWKNNPNDVAHCVYPSKEGPKLIPESAYQIPCD